MYRNILIPLDGSHVAECSLPHVKAIARAFQIHKLFLITVLVPIGKFVETTLWHYVEKIRPKPFSSDCDYLFLSRAGKPITTNAIKLMFSRLAKSAGVERLHAHLCRHTFAVNYLFNGGDIHSLKEILGHTTLEMVNEYLQFTSSQITDLHHRFSPMDKFFNED